MAKSKTPRDQQVSEKMKADREKGKAVQAEKAARAGAGPAERQPDTHSGKAPVIVDRYREVVPALMKEFDYGNVMEVPKVAKVVVNIGIGEAKDNDKALEAARRDVQTITGQAPVIVKARKSVAAFKLRAGMPVGIRTTLRGRRMYYFLEKLINVALPRIRDFRGISPEGFDGRGNYTLGLREQIIFPEIEYDKIDKLRGMEITVVTTARTDEEGRSLLTQLGMPFRKRER
ncbi:MAG: 50S ribosomal protein L5 [Candidatus Dormibacteraceae bacterium]